VNPSFSAVRPEFRPSLAAGTNLSAMAEAS
jgi:hypothetical protein